MAVPKRKTSKQRKRTRAANWKLSAPNLVSCPQCHEKKLSHKVCPNCGYYKNDLVVAPKQKASEE
ncbi:MAG: 50S ribosomal protein L32 [Clostridiales bacterium]|jgi:large subunit ribosomal protein L32|nr:50S ribosomal protein L32 [Clostridiales bacterium]